MAIPFFMDEVVEELRGLEGVKAVRRFSGSLRIELFSRPIPGTEMVEIEGDLRKISQGIRQIMEDARAGDIIEGWEWMKKPEKKYEETTLGKQKVSDRKDKGHKPGFYRVSVRK